jgi:hypothetical protein
MIFAGLLRYAKYLNAKYLCDTSIEVASNIIVLN